MANRTSVRSVVDDHGVRRSPRRAGSRRCSSCIADATRVRILYALLETEELCVNDISAALDVPETSVSHALRLLRIAGVVKNRRAGRLIYYSLDDEHIRKLLRTAREHLAHG